MTKNEFNQFRKKLQDISWARAGQLWEKEEHLHWQDKLKKQILLLKAIQIPKGLDKRVWKYINENISSPKNK